MTVSGDHGAVFIDMVGAIEADVGVAGQEHGGVPGTNNVAIRNQLLGMQSGLLSLRQDNLEMKTAINVIKVNLERCFGILNGNIRRMAMQPARRRTDGGERGGGEAAAEVPGRAAANDLAMMATLMPTPRSLHDLWQEYHHGVSGRKAARLFSYSERGRSKHRYHRTKGGVGFSGTTDSARRHGRDRHRQDLCCLWRSDFSDQHHLWTQA